MVIDGEGAKGLNGNYLRVMSSGNAVQVSHQAMQAVPEQQCMRQCRNVIGSIIKVDVGVVLVVVV